MPSNGTPLDADVVMRAVNPSTRQPSDEVIEAALQRLLSEAPVGRPRRSRGIRRPRIALSAGLLVAVIAAAVAVINLLPATTAPVSVHSTWQDVVARAAAATTGSGNGILHIDMLVTDTGPDVSTPARYRVESWTTLSRPYAYWQIIRSRSDAATTTVVGDRVESYDSASNILTRAVKQIAGMPRAVLFNPAYNAALGVLYPGETVGHNLPPTLPALITRVIRSPHVKVSRSARFDGHRAVRITALGGRAVLYLYPRTYVPLEFVMTGDPAAGPKNHARITMRFEAYETLSRGSVSPPDLQRLHPTARLAS